MRVGATTTLVQLVRTGARLAGQVLLARFGRETVERSNRAARVLVDRVGDGFDPWSSGSGIGVSQVVGRYGDYFSTSTAVHAAVRVRAHAAGHRFMFMKSALMAVKSRCLQDTRYRRFSITRIRSGRRARCGMLPRRICRYGALRSGGWSVTSPGL